MEEGKFTVNISSLQFLLGLSCLFVYVCVCVFLCYGTKIHKTCTEWKKGNNLFLT